MQIWHLLVTPFLEFGFMRRALVASLALSLSSGPLGTFLVLRRMSLMGDALSHALLPGAAIGFLIAGLSLPAMSAGALIAGLAVAQGSGLITRLTPLKEDASFAAFYLISLSLGVLLVSLHGNSVDLLHVLFGTILGIGNEALFLMAGVATITLAAIAIMYRALVLECFDPDFLASLGAPRGLVHALLLGLVVLNLVAGFQALGTLMAVGLMIIPAVAARFWAREVWTLAALSILFAACSGYGGLVASYIGNLPSGPAIVMSAGVIYAISVIAGPRGGLVWVGQRRRIN